MLSRGGTIRLQIPSNYELLDFIQLVCDRLAALAALDDDATHWIGVAVRESVINAIKHGNREDYDKLVTVEFSLMPVAGPTEFVVRVLDQPLVQVVADLLADGADEVDALDRLVDALDAESGTQPGPSGGWSPLIVDLRRAGRRSKIPTGYQLTVTQDA